MTAHRDPPDLRGRRRLAPADRRAQLAAAGARVFVARGYHDTTLELIAAEAGVTRPLIYRYFEDKDELYREILREARDELDRVLVGSVAAAGPVPADQLEAGLRAYFGFVQDRGGQWDLLFGPGQVNAGAAAREFADLRFRTAEMIAGLIHASVPELDPVSCAAYAHAVSGAAEQLATWWRTRDDLTVDTVVGYHLEVVWAGLRRRLDELERGRH